MTSKKFSFVLITLLLLPFYSIADTHDELKHTTQRFYIADDLDNEFQYLKLAIAASEAGKSSPENSGSVPDTATKLSSDANTWPVSEIALACFLLAGFLAARKQSAH